MNSEHPSTERLQRSVDGDLPRGEADAVRTHVSGCAQCMRQLDALSRVGELMRVSAEHDAAQADFSGLFANIERALSMDSEARAVVTPLRAATRPAPSSSLRRLYRAAPALGAIALAASALLMVYRTDQSGDLDETPYEAVATTAHSEVVDVDFGPNAGTVFDISLSDGASIPVVWIDDDDDEE
jgi:anti-sigma factor RsiW